MSRKAGKKTGRAVRNFPEKLDVPTGPLASHQPVHHVTGVRGPAKQLLKELPFSYNKTHLVLLVRDPTWAYAYWDFSGDTWSWIQELLYKDSRTRAKLRVHDVDRKMDYDVDVHLEAKNWYLDLGEPNTAFEAELGLLDSEGRFHLIAKSNRIRTPRNGPSDRIDEAWEAMDFEELYKLSGGRPKGGLSSLELFSPSSPVGRR